QYSRLVGSVPAENLDKLLADARQLVPAKEREAPFANVTPVRIVLVRPDWPVPAGPKALPGVRKGQEKFSPALRSLLGGANAAARQRLEVILASTPTDGTWQRDLERTGVTVEGRTGPLVTVLGVPKAASPRLAALTQVVAIRLPRSGVQAPLLPGTAA